MSDINERTCTICGKLFKPKHFNQKRCSGPHYSKCPVCGKIIPWKEYSRCCSKECTNIMRKQTNLKIYGTEIAQQSDVVKSKAARTCRKNNGVDYPAQNINIRKKQTATYLSNYGKNENLQGYLELESRRKAGNLRKYGVEYSSQAEVKKANTVQTCLNKYGCSNPMQSENIQATWRSKFIASHGVDNPMKDSEIVEKQKQNNVSKYGVSSVLMDDNIRDKIMNTNLERYGVPWYCMTDECKAAQGHIISKLNVQFEAALYSRFQQHGQFEFRLESFSYDIKFNEFLIELNPSYTHNCMFNPYIKSKPGLLPDYHLRKTDVAEKNGFRCIHIWDWDDIENVFDIIDTNRMKIFARNLTVRYNVDANEVSRFLNINHIQKSCRGSKLNVCLLDNDEILGAMTFGTPRYNSNFDYELLRLCFKRGVNIVGGAQKLFKHAVKEFNISSCISYCDKSKFSGSVYAHLGFSVLNSGQPSKIWSKGKMRITDNLLRQRGFDQIFKTDFGKGASNEELMLNHGWLPVYDCGQAAYAFYGGAKN